MNLQQRHLFRTLQECGKQDSRTPPPSGFLAQNTGSPMKVLCWIALKRWLKGSFKWILMQCARFLHLVETGLDCWCSILRYPQGRPGAVDITRADFARLQPGQFLNDSIIEFGLKSVTLIHFRRHWFTAYSRLWHRRLEDTNMRLSSQIYVFSPFFYSKLNVAKYISSTLSSIAYVLIPSSASYKDMGVFGNGHPSSISSARRFLSFLSMRSTVHYSANICCWYLARIAFIGTSRSYINRSIFFALQWTPPQGTTHRRGKCHLIYQVMTLSQSPQQKAQVNIRSDFLRALEQLIRQPPLWWLCSHMQKVRLEQRLCTEQFLTNSCLLWSWTMRIETTKKMCCRTQDLGLWFFIVKGLKVLSI